MIAISKQFTREMVGGHGLIGVLFGAVIYVLCLTGSVLTLVDQLTIWERPGAPEISHLSADDIVAITGRALAEAQRAGLAHDVFVHMPTDELPRMTVFARDGKGGHRDWNVDASGRLVAREETPWVEFVQVLHFNLTAPGPIGRYVVGIFGTILMASIVTGLLAHRRILRDAFRLRWGGTRRLADADLHNRVGVWALPFHLIVALTGSVLGLAGLITIILAMVAYKGDQGKALAALLGPQASEDARAAPPPDIGSMLSTIAQREPGSEVTQIAIEHAATMGQQVRIAIAAPRHLARNEALLFAPDGTLKWRAGFTDGTAGMRIFGMITPLHYGTYGGVVLKLIYAALGAGLTVIVASGGNIWLARQREQGRPRSRLERLWVALIWGQPAIFAIIAALLIVAPIPAVAFYWALTFATLVLALWAGDRAPEAARKALGGALVLLAVTHVATLGISDPIAVTIDLALLVLGVLALANGALGRWLRRR